MSKKDIIYKSGLEEISKRGFFNTKVQDIVERANVSVGTFYNYYHDKNHFLYCVFFEEYSKIHNKVKKIQSSEDSELDKLIILFALLLKDVAINTDAYTILASEKQYLSKVLDSDSYRKIKNIYEGTNGLIISIIEEGQKKGIIKKVEPIFILMLMESFITAFFLKGNDLNPSSNIADMKKFMLDFISVKGGQ